MGNKTQWPREGLNLKHTQPIRWLSLQPRGSKFKHSPGNDNLWTLSNLKRNIIFGDSRLTKKKKKISLQKVFVAWYPI